MIRTPVVYIENGFMIYSQGVEKKCFFILRDWWAIISYRPVIIYARGKGGRSQNWVGIENILRSKE